MTSWHLWRALNHPPRQHPVYQYVLTHAKRDTIRVTSGFFMWVFMCSTLTFFWTIVFDWVSYLLLILLITFNTIYAVRWTLRISETISTEKEQRRYDLLAAMPLGLLGTSWAISTGCVHRRSSFRWMPYLVLLLTLVVSMTLFVVVLATHLIMNNVSATDQALMANINVVYIGSTMIPFMLIFYFDHVYSILTAVLVAQLATIDVDYVSQARIRALLVFLLAQILTYIICYLITVPMLSVVLETLHISGIIRIVIQSMFGLTLFFLLREWLINVSWQTLIRSLDADKREVQLVLAPRSMNEEY